MDQPTPSPHKILAILGTVRQDRQSEHVAKYLMEFWAEQYAGQIDATLVDPRQLNLNWNDEGEDACPPALSEQVGQADAFVLIAPEYNHGYSGSLKYVLDLNYKNYTHKPVAYVGVSDGTFGGARAIQLLVGVTRKMGMVPTRHDLNFGEVPQQFDASGKILDAETWNRRAARTTDELLWMSEALRTARQENK